MIDIEWRIRPDYDHRFVWLVLLTTWGECMRSIAEAYVEYTGGPPWLYGEFLERLEGLG